MQLPTLHPNGTPKDCLVVLLCNASAALEAAYVALKQTAPNGRDHEGLAALNRARDEHMDRLRRVHAVQTEIDALTVAIDKL